MPFDVRMLNPVIPSYRIDESSICRDIHVAFAWDEEWFVKCTKGFAVIKVALACFGLVLMAAQWWALMSVSRWGQELKAQRKVAMDVEKAGFMLGESDVVHEEKTGW